MWDMCQMLNIWHISHTKHKKQLPSDVAYVPKLYNLCPYRCKFATIRTDVVNQNNVFYLAFSFLSLLVLIFSLSLLTSDRALPSTERTKWHSNRIQGEANHLHGWGHSDWIIAIVIVVKGASGMGKATPIITIVIVVVIAIVIADRHHHRHHCFDLADLSLSFLVVGCFDCWWLADFGWWWIGLWVWDLGWVWDFGWWRFFFGVGVDIGCSVCLSFFFFFGSSGWYWWSVVDLWGWPVLVGYGSWSVVWVVIVVAVVDDNGGGDNILF